MDEGKRQHCLNHFYCWWNAYEEKEEEKSTFDCNNCPACTSYKDCPSNTPQECFFQCGDTLKADYFLCKDKESCGKGKGYGRGDFKLSFNEDHGEEFTASLLVYDPQ